MQHFPGITQTVSPRSRQAGQRRPGTYSDQWTHQDNERFRLTGIVTMPSASFIQGTATLSMGVCIHMTFLGRCRCWSCILDDMVEANDSDDLEETGGQNTTAGLKECGATLKNQGEQIEYLSSRPETRLYTFSTSRTASVHQDSLSLA